MTAATLTYIVDLGPLVAPVTSVVEVTATADFAPDGTLVGIELPDLPTGVRFAEAVSQDFASGYAYVRLSSDRASHQETCEGRVLVDASDAAWRIELVAPAAATWLPPA